jgi:MYXO-CTERM domain-containing protein
VKKKTNVSNAAPQPLASSSSSCSTSSGPASAGGFAGLAGLGLALSALGRRRRTR